MTEKTPRKSSIVIDSKPSLQFLELRQYYLIYVEWLKFVSNVKYGCLKVDPSKFFMLDQSKIYILWNISPMRIVIEGTGPVHSVRFTKGGQEEIPISLKVD